MILDSVSGTTNSHCTISRALSHSLPPTVAVMPSVTDFNSSDFFPSGSAGQKKYYNRPKFLQAPDPDTLATPTFSVIGEAGRIRSPLLELHNLPDTFEGLLPPTSFYPTGHRGF